MTLVFPGGSEHSLVVGEDENILAVAYGEGLPLPSMCLQGWCTTCAGRVCGAGEWDQSESRRFYEKDREAGFILLCTAKPRSDLRVQTHQQAAMRDYRLEHHLPTPRAVLHYE